METNLAFAAAVDEQAVKAKIIKGIKALLSESEAIEVLGLKDRPRPGGALRYLIRMKKLKTIRQGRGILTFSADEIKRYLASVAEQD